jgi:hypothetical protein
MTSSPKRERLLTDIPGVSLITQALYAMVFCTRYLDLFWTPPWISYWNTTLKIFYISSSFYIIFIMMRVFARTRELEKAWKFGFACLAGSIIATPFVTMIGEPKANWFFRVVSCTIGLHRHDINKIYSSYIHSPSSLNQFVSYRSYYYSVRQQSRP